jgi:hypothetical protein
VAARRAAAPLRAEIAATLEDADRALERGDRALAERALARGRATEPDALHQAVAGGRETLRLAPFAGATRARFTGFARAASQIDAAITSVEALTCGAFRALDLKDSVPAPVPQCGSGRSRAPPRRLARRPACRGLRPRAGAARGSSRHARPNRQPFGQPRSLCRCARARFGLTREEAGRLIRDSARSLA